jgi:hypothetical protein
MPGLTGSASAKTVPGLSEHPGKLHNGGGSVPGMTAAPSGTPGSLNQSPLGID